MTAPTAVEIVELLKEKGPLTAIEISNELGEHLGRVNDVLFRSNKFTRDDRSRWHLTDEVVPNGENGIRKENGE